MTIDHFDWRPLSQFTENALGFVSVAEGFVIVSGGFFALVYSRYANEWRSLMTKSLKRALLIYGYNLAIAVCVLTLIVLKPSPWGNWVKHLGRSYSDPTYFKYVLLLLYQPTWIDILPMYVFFVLLSPLILIGFNKGLSGVVAAVSFALRLLAHPSQLEGQSI